MVLLYITLTALGLGLFFRKNEPVQQIFYGLLILATLYLIGDQIKPIESAYKMIGWTGGILFLNFTLSRFVSHKMLRWVIPALSIVALAILAPAEISYDIYNVALKQVPVFGLLAGGFVLGAILEVKDWLVKNYIFQLQTLRFGRALLGSILGVMVIGATFFTGFYGFILIAIGLFLYSSYHKKRIGHYIPALLALASVSYFMNLFSLEGLDITYGKVLAGLVIGACMYLLGDVSSRIYKPILGLGLFFIGVALVVVISSLNSIHTAYGGPESFVAAIFGYALASFLIGNLTISALGYPLLVAIGLLVPKSLDQVEVAVVQADGTTTEAAKPKELTFEEYENLSWDELEGSYEIDERSIINFQLGPKGGVTKGAIKNFTGVVDFTGETPLFKVDMKVKELTTYNSMQYESLMSADYFNEPKFPMMNFKSKSVNEITGGKELVGDFKMIGKTHTEIVQIKYLGMIDGKPQFIGKSSIERPKYGFKPSAQEGDVVDFTFQLILKK